MHKKDETVMLFQDSIVASILVRPSKKFHIILSKMMSLFVFLESSMVNKTHVLFKHHSSKCSICLKKKLGGKGSILEMILSGIFVIAWKSMMPMLIKFYYQNRLEDLRAH